MPDRHATLGSLGLDRLASVGPAIDPATAVTGLAVDSREVKPGFVFVAIKGGTLDGAEFAQYAVRQGAAAVVISPEGLEIARRDTGDLPIPFLISHNPRAELSRLAARYSGAQPAVIAAVTGTNGKTSVAHFLRQIWAATGHRAAAFGTTGVEGEGFAESLAMTTPEPIALHALLARLAGKGCTHAAMEASSHGLAQHRLDGVHLSAAALTNITRDHLEYHLDHEDYVAAKLRLFDAVLPQGGQAVLNADDPVYCVARHVAEGRRQNVISVGRNPAADLRLISARYHGHGQEITFSWQGQEYRADLDLIGGFQGENVLMAAALAIATGGAGEAVYGALPALTGVRGRMELAGRRRNGAAVYVDYAHTPDALATALKALRPHCTGRMIVVFGAGGNRDPGKRPMMGQAAAEHADAAIVTDDNPRTEDPAAIRAEVLAGCPEADEIGDRAAAILAGVDALKEPGDCLLIAGKGHESGQDIGTEVIPFDDVDQARAAVGALDGIELQMGSVE